MERFAETISPEVALSYEGGVSCGLQRVCNILKEGRLCLISQGIPCNPRDHIDLLGKPCDIKGPSCSGKAVIQLKTGDMACVECGSLLLTPR